MATLRSSRFIPDIVGLSLTGLLALVTLLTDTGKQMFQGAILNRYDLRFTEFDDSIESRTQIIGVRNNGKDEVSNVLINIDNSQKPVDPINDFSAGPFDSDQQESFINHLKRVGAFKRLKSEKDIGAELDLDNCNSFFDINLALETLLKDKLGKARTQKDRVAIQARFNEIFRELREESCEKWKTATEGIKVSLIPSTASKLGHIEKLSFILTLKADSQRYFRIRRGPHKLTTLVEFDSIRLKHKVGPSDLRASFPLMFWRYDYLGVKLFFSIIGLLLILYLVSILRRFKPAQPFAYFNYAIATNRKKDWEEAFNQYPWDIEAMYQNLCTENRKNGGGYQPIMRQHSLREWIMDRFLSQNLQARQLPANAPLIDRVRGFSRKTKPAFNQQKDLDDAIKEFLNESVDNL